MEMQPFLFEVTDWSALETSRHAGDPGVATWRTRTFDAIRVRMVEYSPGYVADHWSDYSPRLKAGGSGCEIDSLMKT
jgi:hypothetical protein